MTCAEQVMHFLEYCAKDWPTDLPPLADEVIEACAPEHSDVEVREALWGLISSGRIILLPNRRLVRVVVH